jgi:hypothetical protein
MKKKSSLDSQGLNQFIVPYKATNSIDASLSGSVPVIRKRMIGREKTSPRMARMVANEE